MEAGDITIESTILKIRSMEIFLLGCKQTPPLAEFGSYPADLLSV